MAVKAVKANCVNSSPPFRDQELIDRIREVLERMPVRARRKKMQKAEILKRIDSLTEREREK
ncbi:MAG: hypothetical protein R3E67_03455 [Pseudomonadales bacterium]